MKLLKSIFVLVILISSHSMGAVAAESGHEEGYRDGFAEGSTACKTNELYGCKVVFDSGNGPYTASGASFSVALAVRDLRVNGCSDACRFGKCTNSCRRKVADGEFKCKKIVGLNRF